MGTTIQLFHYNVSKYLSERYYVSSVDYSEDNKISNINIILSNYELYPIVIKSNTIISFYEQCEALYGDDYFEYMDQMHRLVDTAMFVSLNSISKRTDIDIKDVLDRSIKSKSKSNIKISGFYYIELNIRYETVSSNTILKYYVSSISKIRSSGHYDFEISNMKYNSLTFSSYKEAVIYFIYIIKHPKKILSNYRLSNDNVTSMTMNINYSDKDDSINNVLSITMNNIKGVR